MANGGRACPFSFSTRRDVANIELESVIAICFYLLRNFVVLGGIRIAINTRITSSSISSMPRGRPSAAKNASSISSRE